MPSGKKQKKTAPGKKSGKKSGKDRNLKKAAACIIFLVILTLLLGIMINEALKKKNTESQKQVAAVPEVLRKPIPTVKEQKLPDREILTPSEKKDLNDVSKPEKKYSGKLPLVAIIMDDMGHDQKLAEKLLSLNAEFTFSILPFSTHKIKIAEMARAKGLEVLIHLPMEPLDYPAVSPGQGALMTTMSPDELMSKLNENLDAVPNIKGVNNHMGSKMTASSEQMNQIFSGLKKRGFFFIDSRTTPDSKARSSARLFHVPYAERDIFLDSVQDSEAIRKQIRLLINKAETKGAAIGIGHPYPLTLQILEEELPEILKKVNLVPASSLVRTEG